MDRRAVILGAGATALAPFTLDAQQPVRTVPLIGYLTPFSLSGQVSAAFREGLRDHGYVEGKNIRIEYRTTDGRDEKYVALAAELVNLRPNILVAQGGAAALAFKPLTRSIPIVMAGSADAVAQGIVASLSRPGGNITGFTLITPALVGKRFAILKEASPTMARVTAVGCGGVGYELQLRELALASRVLGIAAEVVEYRGPDSVASTFEQIERTRPDGLVILDCPKLPFVALLEFARRTRLPSISPYAGNARFGGLMDYGPDGFALTRATARYIDRILKGANPSDLPIEQPTKFELVINLTTARALGLTIPPTLLQRADQVIE